MIFLAYLAVALLIHIFCSMYWFNYNATIHKCTRAAKEVSEATLSHIFPPLVVVFTFWISKTTNYFTDRWGALIQERSIDPREEHLIKAIPKEVIKIPSLNSLTIVVLIRHLALCSTNTLLLSTTFSFLPKEERITTCRRSGFLLLFCYFHQIPVADLLWVNF